MVVIPIINKDVSVFTQRFQERLSEPSVQRKVILVIVSVALLLDNMLYMVIVPIIPDYLRRLGSWDTHREGGDVPVSNPPPSIIAVPTTLEPPVISFNDSWLNVTIAPLLPASPPPLRNLGKLVYVGEDSAIGVLFASKAIVQLMINPFSGTLIDRIGYDIPMMIGLGIMFLSTAVFACGQSYTILFLARSLQGAGSAFADTSGLAMIADRFTVDTERSKALGIANAFISFGCLVAPPFGGLLYEFAGKQFPFLILSLVCLIDAFLVFFVMRPTKVSFAQLKIWMSPGDSGRPKGTPLWRLMTDPHIAVVAGALSMSNVALAFLEPTISKWMMDNMQGVSEWQIGLIWLPAFFPHVLGVYLTVKLARSYPQYQWVMASAGLALEGLSCFIVPFARSPGVLIIPLCGICFGIALIDTALLPTLGHLVDVRYVSVYGSIYAIADISYSIAYAFGPIIAGGIVESIGFLALNIVISVTNLLYAPVLCILRHVYDYKTFEDDEANVLTEDPPPAHYQTYMMHDSHPEQVKNELKNHLEYSVKQPDIYQETPFHEPRVASSQPQAIPRPQIQSGYQSQQPELNRPSMPNQTSVPKPQPGYQSQQPEEYRPLTSNPGAEKSANLAHQNQHSQARDPQQMKWPQSSNPGTGNQDNQQQQFQQTKRPQASIPSAGNPGNPFSPGNPFVNPGNNHENGHNSVGQSLFPKLDSTGAFKQAQQQGVHQVTSSGSGPGANGQAVIHRQVRSRPNRDSRHRDKERMVSSGDDTE